MTTTTDTLSIDRIKAVTRELMPRIREALGLTDWDINVIYSDDDPADGLSPGVRFTKSASVHIKGEYLHAAVVLYVRNIASEERLRNDLVHECIHITQWMFWNYSNVIGNLLPKACREADETAWTHAVERHVQEVMRWPHIKALYAVPRGVRRGRDGGKQAGKVKP